MTVVDRLRSINVNSIKDAVVGTKTGRSKRRGRAIALALSGVFIPGLHKFYLGQHGWGIAYLLLWPTYIPQIASVIEGFWYGSLAQDEFDHNFNSASQSYQQSRASADAPASSSASPPIDLRSRLQTDPTYRLQSPEEVAIAASLGIEIDVNRATESDWLRLPIITEAQGRSLVTLKEAGVQFLCLEDLAAALSVSVEPLMPLAPILKFYYYELGDVSNSSKVNPNQASIATLSKLPGMTLPLALQITHHRSSKPFQDLADLQQRLSLPASTVETLMHYVQF
jgi:DNA uptake protein ComE-like DNA-binding protein/TM2 domain-containing membrane protein YozV